MILQYFSKVSEQDNIETIVDNISMVTIGEERIQVEQNDSGRINSTDYLKKDSQIYNMWLLNDNFKTLRQLI